MTIYPAKKPRRRPKSKTKPLQKSAARKWRRKPSDYARIYGSRARASWVKSLPCLVCDALSHFFGEATAGKCDNAHTVSGGMGKKAGYETIVPLCRNHHRRYDDYLPPFEDEASRNILKAQAAMIEKLWQATQRKTA